MKNNKFANIKEGEFLSFTQYFKVISKRQDSIVVKNQLDQELEIVGIDLIESLHSAGQYTETKVVGKNEVVQALHSAKDKVFTVCFLKANGEERILIGHLHNIESYLGRTNVIDLEVPVADKTLGHRQVDNRNIEWLVIDNIKYITNK
jgi:hypothetical protein